MSDILGPERLAREIIVRHRGRGHVRFAVPDALCAEADATAIENLLRGVDGVYRATLYRGQGKLSVFYDEHVCGVHDVARALYAALAGLGRTTAPRPTLRQRLAAANPSGWLRTRGDKARAKLEEWRFKAKMMKEIVAYHPQLKGMLSEKTVINFLNDLVVFYLIKAHWDLITQKWFKQPWKYRNAWLSTFYLVFLLVRSRKQSAKQT